MTNVEQTFDVNILDKAACADIEPGKITSCLMISMRKPLIITITGLVFFFSSIHVLKKANAANGK